jgi:hypothetical protein
MRKRVGGALGVALAVACGGQGPSRDNPNPAFAAADPCDGLLPSLPAAQTFISPAGGAGGDVCGVATTDGLGFVHVDNMDPTVGLIFFVPLVSGSASLGRGMTPNRYFTGFAADGTMLFEAPVSLSGPFGMQANGGAIFSSITFDDRVETARFEFLRFDDKGVETRVILPYQAAPFPEGTEAILVDTKDRILIMIHARSGNSAVPAPRLVARWFDSSGPLTDWFDAGVGSAIALRPLIGGGAALLTENGWVATVASGNAGLGPPPAGFEAGKDSHIVFGGRAYAMVPVGTGSIDIVEPGGKLCGSVAVQTVTDRFFIGKDGTLIDVTGPSPHPYGPNNHCTATYYPRMLR